MQWIAESRELSDDDLGISSILTAHGTSLDIDMDIRDSEESQMFLDGSRTATTLDMIDGECMHMNFFKE